MKLTFGKYKGTEISDLIEIDKNYLIWLACNSYSVRHEAQKVYIDWLKSEGMKPKEYQITSQTYDDDLKWLVTIKIGKDRYSLAFHNRSNFEKISETGFDVVFEYPFVIFKNMYDKKSRRWIGARFDSLRHPIVRAIEKKS